VLTGFTGYTWDAVLDVYFAQARLYDAGSKRFVQADPVGGSVANPLSLNAYLYCRDDPVNNIDPTGMVMPGDEKRSEVDQAAIAAATFAWNKANAAGDAAGKAAAHAAAEYVRNNPSSGNTNINITPRVSGEKTNINNFPYPGMGYHSLPPSGTTVLMKALSVTSKKALSIDEIRKTANEWMVPVETVRRLQLTTVPVAPKPKPTVIAPIEPIPKLTAITPIEPIPKLLIPTESTIEASAQRKNGVSGALASVGGAFQSDIFRGSGEANAAYGEVNARLQAESKVSGKSGIIGVFGKASAGNAAGEIGIGNDSFSESLKGVGDVGTVSAQAGLQVKNGFGLALGAKATAVSGRATVEFNILGLEVEVGVTGYAGGVGGEIMAGYFPDEGFKIKADAIAIVGGGILFRVKP
jgi:RHS repeat-associated protein